MSQFDAARDMARRGRLYPGVILYGSHPEARHEAAVDLARTLLCAADAPARPCGRCRGCTRITWPEAVREKFHPDFHVLERDLRTVTSVDATKKFLANAGASPFEARGQVFVLAEADSLSGGAADALLKIIEEPPERSPRHFLLLAPSRLDLLPTLRSRSLSIYLGNAEQLDADLVAELVEELARSLDAYFATAAPVLLLTAAETLRRIPGWNDTRAKAPWATAAAVVLGYSRTREHPVAVRRALLALAEELMGAWHLRLRAIPPERILEGLLSKRLAGLR